MHKIQAITGHRLRRRQWHGLPRGHLVTPSNRQYIYYLRRYVNYCVVCTLYTVYCVYAHWNACVDIHINNYATWLQGKLNSIAIVIRDYSELLSCYYYCYCFCCCSDSWELLRLGRFAVVLGIMELKHGDARGPITSLLQYGCMIPLLAIKFSVSGTPRPNFLVYSHPFDWIVWVQWKTGTMGIVLH